MGRREAELSANEVDVRVFPSTIERGRSRSNGQRASGDFLIENQEDINSTSCS
jgi:hypothetical protein